MPKKKITKNSYAVRNNIVDVGVAIISSAKQYLIARKQNGKWEFPGGKREHGERIRSSIKREIMEELGIEIRVDTPFLVTKREQNGRIYKFHFAMCEILKGVPQALEHSSIRWCKKRELLSVDLQSADLEVLAELK
jgi:mutator protein MutT